MPDETEQSPHDALFKAAFTRLDAAAGLIRSVLGPTVSGTVDWDTLELRPGTHVDEHLRQRHSDLLYRVRIGGRDALVYVLVEHQSTPDPRMPRRVYEYVDRIWTAESDGLRLPLVIPIVVYAGLRSWKVPCDVAELVDVGGLGAVDEALPIPSVRFLLDDLRAQTPQQLRDRALPAFGALALWALRAAPDRSFADTVTVFADVVRALVAEDGPAALAVILRYLGIVAGRSREEVLAEVLQRLDPACWEGAVSLWDIPVRSEEENRELGRLVGRAEGQRHALATLIETRLGPVTDEVRQRLDAATPEQLDRWLRRILTADSLDALFRD